MSIKRRSLKYKLMIAFSLMSIIPLLIMAYFITNYVFPTTEDLFQISAMVLFALWVSGLGYILSKEIILPVIDLALETKIIATGQYDARIAVGRDDELGEIAHAVNTMTSKIRDYIWELQEYSKKTAALNMRIHKKVLTLTSLMRLGDLISSGARFKEIANFTTERVAGEFSGGFCAIFIKERTGSYYLESFFNSSSRDIDTNLLLSEIISLEKLFARKEYLSVDANPSQEPWQALLRKKMEGINLIVFPIKENVNVLGVLVFGSFDKEITFGDEDIDIFRAFEKELILGYQSSQVFKKAKVTEVIDSLTGVYTFSYLEERLEDEINRAVYYQRPCSLIIIEVNMFEEYAAKHGLPKSKKVLKEIAKLIGVAVPPVGKIARSRKHEFAVLLPEKNKRDSLKIAEGIRDKIGEVEVTSGEKENIDISIGVGENPIDGATAEDIIARTREYVAKAKTLGPNQIVGE